MLRSPSGKHVGRSLQKADAAFLDFSRRRYGIPLNVIIDWNPLTFTDISQGVTAGRKNIM